jgi:hypothetical protein
MTAVAAHAGAGKPASLLEEHDIRLAQLERASFVGEPEEDDSRASRCPYCGGALKVFAQSDQIVRDDKRE